MQIANIVGMSSECSPGNYSVVISSSVMQTGGDIMKGRDSARGQKQGRAIVKQSNKSRRRNAGSKHGNQEHILASTQSKASDNGDYDRSGPRKKVKYNQRVDVGELGTDVPKIMVSDYTPYNMGMELVWNCDVFSGGNGSNVIDGEKEDSHTNGNDLVGWEVSLKVDEYGNISGCL